MTSARGFRRADLLGDGWTSRSITAAVRAGTLIRARNGFYVTDDTEDRARKAASLGGRITCLTALAKWGVFVREERGLHIHLVPNTVARPRIRVKHHKHWDAPLRTAHPQSLYVEPLDALLHAMHCQELQSSIASIDSALHLGLITEDDLDDLFDRLPRRFRVLRTRCDGRAESGPESLVRYLLDRLGCRYEVQVDIEGVGRVDFLVEGWLIIECDSEAHHAGWKQRRRDLRRDQAAATLGLSTYRPIAEDIMWNSDAVWAALTGLVRSERRIDGAGTPRRALAGAVGPSF